ncbi:MAG: BrnA antitoxin family protein [Betaproteobacteria bacterium]|nr:BrnA antitoxin family protein [Betaproteobacteria bacterium]
MRRPKRISKADWKAVDSPGLKKADFAKMRRASAAVPQVVEAARRARGRPKLEVTKELVSLRLSPVVLDHFRSQGSGWQTRINHLLEDIVVLASDVAPAERAEVTKKIWSYIKRSYIKRRGLQTTSPQSTVGVRMTSEKTLAVTQAKRKRAL